MTIRAQDFQFISELIHKRSGIALSKGKEYLLESRLEELCKSRELENLEALANALRGRASLLLDDVVDALTTNETFFFRDPGVFYALRETIIPKLIDRLQPGQPLRIWCAASSSGQEPVSLILMLHRFFPELSERGIEITATDISPSMVERCKSGLYRNSEITRGLPPEYLKHFSRCGTDWKLDDEFLDKINYRLLNLTHAFPFGQINLVMIRNVLIYFNEDTKLSILARARRVMEPGGALMLGGTEASSSPHFQRTKANEAFYYEPLSQH
ncbi:MAG: protein-glutamate O-methyltransferase CheR [Gammaproteobacteria bacterium]|nr:protein-glutamate O-methyltransferase CheR [Gammaproteobacteria bacterium]